MEGFHAEIGFGSKITVHKSGKVVNSLEFLTWKAVKTIGKKQLKSERLRRLEARCNNSYPSTTK